MTSREGISARLHRRQRPWDGLRCFPLDYPTGPAARGDPRRGLVRAFKEGDPRAIHLASDFMSDALLQCGACPNRNTERRLLVPVPGHIAGPASQSLDLLCRKVAKLLPSLMYVPDLLVRTQTVRQSAVTRHRPATEEHFETLAWTGGRLGYSVILIDDVFTFGRVTTATLHLLQGAGAREVVVACLARTTW
jgi:predicted amidophosphoribosyltransferase